jgi:hypothetical protein
MPALHLRSEGLAEGLGVLFDGAFVALVPSPVTLFLGFDQAGFLQNSHMVRNGGLGKVDAFFYVARAKANLFSDRTSAPKFQNLQDAPAGRVGNRVQETGKGLLLAGHGVEIDRKSMAVNVDRNFLPWDVERRRCDFRLQI